MTFLNILIVEDVLLTAKDICRTLEKAGHRVTAIARTLEAARESVLASPPDLALIDIRLENSAGDGIETAKELLRYHKMPIIYLTANSDLRQFWSAQETRPAAYLLKPFKVDELIFNIELAHHNYQFINQPATLPGHLMLPTKGGLEMITLSKVVYLQADGVYAKVILSDGNTYMVSTGLGQLEIYFDPPSFFRLSRSHIVNLSYIKCMKDNELILDFGQIALQVPTGNRKELLKRIKVVRTKPNHKS